jgi:hypothetical protein
LAESARERLSAEMDFEGAALMHQRLQRVEEVLGLRDEMARDIETLNAIAMTPSDRSGCSGVGMAARRGSWQGFSRIEFNQRRRHFGFARCEIAGVGAECSLQCRRERREARMEQLATIARWFYSSWCDGELLLVDDWAKIPYRKLVNAVSRIAQNGQPLHRPSNHS